MYGKLIDLDFGGVKENCILDQSDLSYPLIGKYCSIVFLPQKGINFKFELYAKHLEDNKDNVFPCVHELYIRKGVYFRMSLNTRGVQIPKYDLNFKKSSMDLRCLSHSCQFIKFDSEMLVLKFASSFPTIDLMASLYETETPSKELPKTLKLTLVQKNFASQELFVYCLVPFFNKRYKLTIFAKDLQDKTTSTYGSVTDFHVVRATRSELPSRRLTSLFQMDKSEFFIQEPLFYELARGQVHSFSVLIKKAPEKVCVKFGENYIYFEQDTSNALRWKLDTSFDASGSAKVYVKYSGSNSYQGLTEYKVV